MIGETPIFEKKNVLVTGGAGFLGSHLCERLLKEAKVICMDDLSNSKINNIEHLLQYPDFEFIKYDTNKKIDLDDFEELAKFKVKFQGIQEIYHLACPTSPKNFEKLKLNSLWANSNGMISTLDLAVKHKAKYVFASSSVIYGPPREGHSVFKEEDEGIVNHLSPRGCYDEGKRFAETCVETYRQVYGLDAKIARVFTTFGPRMKLRDGFLIPDFIIAALEGKDLVIYGTEDMEQSLCYVTDMVDGIVRLMRTGPEMSLVNLGHDRPIKIGDVARKIIEMTDSSSQVVTEDPLVFLTPKGIPNLTRAKEDLGWIPLILLEDGLKKTIDYTIANKEMLGG
ncbi:MAG: NAD-dependent epimerase/dehydratase family protein [Candidatus Magasanikbacteria bacterium]|mgnify:FL=1|jgi:nucleoside-diphosphate-sugar epimerase|nr:NAD-dependent epimerase/dehydratase family protein [Candidatus Magasanikbacteria bacterium]MBT4314795.1 NAD-dependent epimerase/dehydratase family protein [Candidatus Magasanikbacteria bacterium]MBT4547572.1 NAD-dependent epimerase/dehydratase family protein [Candidatus Magasanikbacteria bacterium]MBT6818821.1 NAD-dependent epimerase/dehydratase family protein [Candidatus Magasanikbacteria bacterium]